MDEFDFIKTHLAPLSGIGAEGLEDDCAWIDSGKGWIVVSTDTSVEGVHFPRSVKGAAATERAVRVAASDIAAKGAIPTGMLVALTVPNDTDERMMAAYALGIGEASKVLNLPLLGGDTTRHDGPIVITVTAIGHAKRKVLRSTAKVGDLVYLSGPVGSSALGLRLLMGDPVEADGAAYMLWEEAFLRPDIDFSFGRKISEVATSSIDCSDGLLADTAHLAIASKVRIEIDAAQIPFEASTAEYAHSDVSALQSLVTAGDDYRIIFTAPMGVGLGTPIGRVVEGSGVALLRGGRDITPMRLGYRH